MDGRKMERRFDDGDGLGIGNGFKSEAKTEVCKAL